jgi:hypothetical protein
MAIKTYRHIRTGRTVQVVEGTRLAKLVSKDEGYEVAESPKPARRTAAKSSTKPAEDE